MGLLSKRADKRIAAYQRELIDIHYREVDTMYRKMRGWRHDYRNHISVMKNLYRQGSLKELGEYLDMLESDLSTVDTVIKTGNPMADAILNSKLNLALSKNIPVKATVHIPMRLMISELDLCVILGNLLDNAIEASLPLPEKDRMIRIYMDIKDCQFYLK